MALPGGHVTTLHIKAIISFIYCKCGIQHVLKLYKLLFIQSHTNKGPKNILVGANLKSYIAVIISSDLVFL